MPSNHSNQDPGLLIIELRQHFQQLRRTTERQNGEHKTFIFKDLTSTKQGFVRHKAVKGTMLMPYDGPFPIISHSKKTFLISFHNRQGNISIDHLNPAKVLWEKSDDERLAIPTYDARPQEQHQPVLQDDQQPTIYPRRFTRRVHLADRYEVGFV